MNKTGLRYDKKESMKLLDDMLSRSKSMKAGFSRLYPLYQKFQLERFKSEGGSEGKKWDPLTTIYSKYKGKHFRSFPGGGTKMMIASGTLAGAVIGPGAPFSGTDRHRVIFSAKEMVVSVEESGLNADGKKFEYAGYANEKRDVMTFSQEHIDQMVGVIRSYLVGM